MATAGTSTITNQALTPNVRTFPTDARTGLSLPVHYWLAALKWSGMIMLAMTIIYAIEKYLLGHKGTPMRMVHNPAEFSIRFFGFAHYTVATYLLFTSKKLRHARGYLMMALFSLLAATSCLTFYLIGGSTNKLVVVAVFFFFIMHALRDETFFYRLRAGKAIRDDEFPHVYRMSLWLQVAGLFLLAGILYPAYTFQYYTALKEGESIRWFYSFFPADWSMAMKMTAVTAPFFLIAAAVLAHIQRSFVGGTA